MAVNLSLLVSVAAILSVISLALVVYLMRTASDQFHKATIWYGASTVSLLVAVLGVLTANLLPFALTATLVITGAHFGIVCAYGAFRHTALRPLDWRRVAVLSGGVCLVQGAMAIFADTALLLMISSSLVNSLLAFYAASDIMRLSRMEKRFLNVLLGLPFAIIGLAYVMRLVALADAGSAGVAAASTAIIAFILGVASMSWGFALIIQREAAMNQELVKARLQAETMSRQRARFFAQMNHEIRTPLNGILGLSELLKPHLPDGEGAALLAELQSSGNLLLSIANEVLDFSKAEAGHVQLETLPIDVREVLQSATGQYRRLAASKNVNLDLQIRPQEFPTIMGDPTRLSQILHNLLSNALKFTRAGEIAVTLTRPEPGMVTISIRDTGIGMTQDQINTLFLPFHQGAAETTRRYGGTGLGMSIVKMLVDAMNGQIRVESRPGQGTTIALDLPLPDAPTAARPAPQPGAAADWATDCAKLSILCADDDPINRLVLQALLQLDGIDPVMAEDGHEAVRLACLQRFDAYLIDISMPGMDGVETLMTLREGDSRQPGVKPMAVAVTANVMTEDVDSYFAAGFDAHLPKPIRREELETILRAILSRKYQTV
jgi:signal transduction histidine kinase/ActR/RegA family two-component response regulator